MADEQPHGEQIEKASRVHILRRPRPTVPSLVGKLDARKCLEL
ncbi:MAG: hypothetical protein RL091_2745, partial [Verrucomicrobiota bacterium]